LNISPRYVVLGQATVSKREQLPVGWNHEPSSGKLR
jgi:hypothetical protein